MKALKSVPVAVAPVVVAGADAVAPELITAFATSSVSFSDAGRGLVDGYLAGFTMSVDGQVYPEALKFNTSAGKGYLKTNLAFAKFHNDLYKALFDAKLARLPESMADDEKKTKADAHAADYRSMFYRNAKAARAALLSGGADAQAKATAAKSGAKSAPKSITELNIQDALSIFKRIANAESPSKDDIVVQGYARDMLSRYGVNTEGQKLGAAK